MNYIKKLANQLYFWYQTEPTAPSTIGMVAMVIVMAVLILA